jgi:hypothetical protein
MFPKESSVPMKELLKIAGFLDHPKTTAGGKRYRGRFQCPEVQWTISGNEPMGTFTITAEQLADAASNSLLWTDHDVQRGIKPEVSPQPPRELNLADGYPDKDKYIFQGDNADNMVEKLLYGEKLYLNPLIWNMRPGSFEAYWDNTDRELYIYSGKIYLPDSHHRHQAIVKAVSCWRAAPKEYPKFHGSTQFKVELYFLSRQDEGLGGVPRLALQSCSRTSPRNFSSARFDKSANQDSARFRNASIFDCVVLFGLRSCGMCPRHKSWEALQRSPVTGALCPGRKWREDQSRLLIRTS